MAPTTNLIAFSGTRRSGARAASPAAPTTASAAPAAARHPMLRLTASTIVNASTHSTAAVRKVGVKTVQSSMVARSIDVKAIAPLRRGNQLDEIGAAMSNDFHGGR